MYDRRRQNGLPPFWFVYFLREISRTCLTFSIAHKISAYLPPRILDGSYNKGLAWMDSILEYIVERLYFLLPTLLDVLGDLTPNLQVGRQIKY